MSNGMNPNETDAEAIRAWIAALSNMQIDDPMHSTLSERELVNNSNDADVMMTISKSKGKSLIKENVDQTYAERT